MKPCPVSNTVNKYYLVAGSLSFLCTIFYNYRVVKWDAWFFFCSLSVFVMLFLFSELHWLQFAWFVSYFIFWPVSFKCFVDSLALKCSSTISSLPRCKVFMGSTSKRLNGSSFDDSCPFSNVIRASSTRVLIKGFSSNWGFEFSISWG